MMVQSFRDNVVFGGKIVMGHNRVRKKGISLCEFVI